MMRRKILPLLWTICAMTTGPAALAGQQGRLISPSDEVRAVDNGPDDTGHKSADNRQAVVRGQLPNGLRYAILKRQGDEPGVAIRIRVKGGFLAEQRPGERGLAHLVEHLVFFSPTEKAPDKLWRFREVALPLTFFEPAGGTTSWRESDYFVVSRTSRAADLDTLLGIYNEVLTELALQPYAVDYQRAEVMREMADKKLGNDLYAGYIAAIAPGSPTDVINAQNSDDVPSATIDRIGALYRRLYRPENTELIIVGDVDPAAMGEMINARFGAWRGRGRGRDLPPAQYEIPQFRADRIDPVSYSTFEYGRNTVTLTSVAPLPAPPASRQAQADAMILDMLASQFINNRLAAKRPDYPRGKFGFYIEQGDMGHRLMIFWDDFALERWQPAVASLLQTRNELQSAGFDGPELERAKKEVLAELEQRAQNARAATNFSVAKELADALTLGKYLIAPDELLRTATATLPSLTAEKMHIWWQNQWHDQTSHLRVESPALKQIDDPKSAITAIAAETGRNIDGRLAHKN